ncbi:CYRIA/CYRIB Rac1 binding domain-containing protein [Entamoeba marina]
MGGILSIFQSGQSGERIVIDFENVTPSDEEMQTWSSVNDILKKATKIIDEISNFRGNDGLVREAITNPSQENEIAVEFDKLVSTLANADAKISLTNFPALCKQFGLALDFVLQFDTNKLSNSGIQNDFSYYRRTLNRMKKNFPDSEYILKDDEANKMAMFFASPSPMIKLLTDYVHNKTFMNKPIEIRENFEELLSLLANVCHDMVDSGVFENIETNYFCLRVMAGCIVLYDTVCITGAFSKKSKIRVRECIVLLKRYKRGDVKTEEQTDLLLNTIRFTAKVNAPDVPGTIKGLLM